MLKRVNKNKCQRLQKCRKGKCGKKWEELGCETSWFKRFYRKFSRRED